jgi:hypothetical protein
MTRFPRMIASRSRIRRGIAFGCMLLAALTLAALPQKAGAQITGTTTLTETKTVTGNPPGQQPISTLFHVTTSCTQQGGSTLPIQMTFTYNGAGVFNNGLFLPTTCTTTEVLPPPFTNAAGQTCTWQPPTYSQPNPLSLTSGATHSLNIANSYICGSAQPKAILKICKVAGNSSVPQGTLFAFNYASSAGSGTFPSVPAGSCVVGPSLPATTVVTVTETGPPGYGVTSITGTPPPTGINLPAGSANITLVAGVNELTYTNIATKGYLEICKVAGRGVQVGQPYTFNAGGNTQTIPAGPGPDGYCGPYMSVPAGQVVITETPVSGSAITSCTTLPNATPCTTTATTATVTVNAGGVSDQTVAIIRNN